MCVSEYTVQGNLLNLFIDRVMHGFQLPIFGMGLRVEEGLLFNQGLFICWEVTVDKFPYSKQGVVQTKPNSNFNAKLRIFIFIHHNKL